MWYDILINNEFSDYFINSDSSVQDPVEKQKADKMLDGLKKLLVECRAPGRVIIDRCLMIINGCIGTVLNTTVN